MLVVSVSREGVLGEVLGLGQDVIKIGTLDSCQLRLLEDPGVSGMHALIERGASPRIIDLGSATGTRVDGERVVSAALERGSRVAIGEFEIELFRVVDQPWPAMSGDALARELGLVCLEHARRRLVEAGPRALESCADAVLLAWERLRDPELPELLGDLRELLGVAREPLTPASTKPWLDRRGLAKLDELRRALLPRMYAGGDAWIRRAFEHEIRLDPEDDDPRRVYADWLLARGELRGEFITLQLAEHAGQLDARGRERLAQLWREHQGDWAGAFVKHGAEVEFRRGFVARVSRSGTWPEALEAACRPWRNLLDESTRLKAC